MKKVRRMGSWVVALGVVAGCGGTKESVPEPPSPRALPPATTAPAKTTSAAPAAAATLLKEYTLGTTKVRVEECAFDAAPSSKTDDPIKAIARAGDRLYVANGTSGVAVYAIGAGCKLSLDKAQGAGGTIDVGQKIEGLSADGKGTVYASNGVFDAYRIQGGKVAGKCANHYLAAAPDGATGYTFFVSATMAKVDLAAGCKTSDWVLRSMNDPQKRQGSLTGVTALGFLDGNVLVGGSAVEPKDARVVVALDPATGAEKLRFGNPKALEQDGFGWIHAVTACKVGVCVADANFKAVSLWTKAGKFVGRVSLADALSTTDTPWDQTLATTEDGSLLVGISLRGSTGNVGKVVRFVFSP